MPRGRVEDPPRRPLVRTPAEPRRGRIGWLKIAQVIDHFPEAQGEILPPQHRKFWQTFVGDPLITRTPPLHHDLPAESVSLVRGEMDPMPPTGKLENRPLKIPQATKMASEEKNGHGVVSTGFRAISRRFFP